MASPSKPQAKTTESTFFTFLIFSILIATSPIVVYYLSVHRYFDVVYKHTTGIISDQNLPGVSGILAAIVVQVVVGCFIFIAFREPDVASQKKQVLGKTD